MIKFVRVHIAYMNFDAFKLFIQIIDDKKVLKKEVPNDTENYLVRACLFFN